MDKKELYKKVEDLDLFCLGIRKYVALSEVMYLIKQLDEPQKVMIPQFVADYIKDAKYYEWDLDDAFDHIAEESGESEISKWFYTLGNIDIFARAWLDGFEIEKEKKYIVKVNNTMEASKYLKYEKVVKKWYFGMISGSDAVRLHHTKDELTEGGFGWVFSCEGVEVEEVTK